MHSIESLDLLTAPDTSPKRILVTGSRNFKDYRLLGKVLMDEIKGSESVTVVHGDCPTGADEIASRWVNYWISQVPFGPTLLEEKHPADWAAECQDSCSSNHRRERYGGTDYCPAEGVYRNERMVKLGAHIVLAFPIGRSPGTRNCLRLAQRAGIEVKIFEG